MLQVKQNKLFTDRMMYRQMFLRLQLQHYSLPYRERVVSVAMHISRLQQCINVADVVNVAIRINVLTS